MSPPAVAPAPRYVAVVGDAEDPRSWSGIPFHFLQAGRNAGILDEGLPLAVDGAGWRIRRRAWNLWSMLTLDRTGGYQYSPAFLERLWAPHHTRIRNSTVVNCFQLYPASIVADTTVHKWFYIDQTLLQLFDHYGERSTVGRRIAASAIRREREGYRAAAGIFPHSAWAAESLLKDYGIPASKVHVTVPGANLDLEAYARWAEGEGARRKADVQLLDGSRPLRLVSVGKDWRRKGLDRLLGAFRIARSQGANISLRLLGCPREELPAGLRDIEGIEWYGFVDKRREAVRFMNAVAECDVGCLLSRAEAGGIVVREYLALGLSVLGTTAGGSPDHVLREASELVTPEASNEDIAGVLLRLDSDRALVAKLRNTAWQQRERFLYPETISQIQAVWAKSAKELTHG